MYLGGLSCFDRLFKVIKWESFFGILACILQGSIGIHVRVTVDAPVRTTVIVTNITAVYATTFRTSSNTSH